MGSPFNLASMFNPGDLAFFPGGDFVYIVNGDQMDGTLIVLDSDMLQPVAESPIHVGDAPFPVAVSPDGRVFVGNTGDSTITILDASLKPVPGSPLHSPSPGAMVFTLDGSTIFVSNQSGTWVSIFDTVKLQQVRGAPVQVCDSPSQGAGGMAVSSDGTRVFVATGQGIAVLTPSASGGVPAGSVPECST